jgi:hypothetical protein
MLAQINDVIEVRAGRRLQVIRPGKRRGGGDGAIPIIWRLIS